jgi:Thiol:disulfide interchange protein DsbD, N-terminal
MSGRRALAAEMVLASLGCLASLGLWGQDWTGGGNPAPRVEMAWASPVRVEAGGDSTVTLNFRVRPNFHINSNKPGSKLLIPTVLKLSPPTDIIVGSTDYPAGKDMKLSFAPGEKLNVYTGNFEVTTRVITMRKTPPGNYRVRGDLKYQACDNRACYPPTTIPVIFDVTVARASSGHTRRNPAQSPHAR